MARISLRSRAWHGDTGIELAVPDAWNVEVLPPADAPELGEEELARALGDPTLEEAARGRGTALIVVDDLGRPTPAHRIVPHLLRMLSAAGVPEGGISFLVATGSHRQLSAEEVERKLGAEVCRRYPVHCHDAFSPDLRDLGRLSSGMPVIVNGRVVDAGIVIGVSCVLPHTLTGFSGGGKILLPGCAGILSIAELHSFETKRPRGAAEPAYRRPDAREVIDAFAERAGLEFSVNVVVNSRRRIAAVAAGEAKAAHAAAVEQARRIYRTEIPEELRREAGLVIANSYPLDADPVQVSKSQWPRRVFPDARLVLHDPACDGIAYHGWSEFQKASMINMLCGAIGQARTDGCCPGPLGALVGSAPPARAGSPAPAAGGGADRRQLPRLPGGAGHDPPQHGGQAGHGPAGAPGPLLGGLPGVEAADPVPQGGSLPIVGGAGRGVASGAPAGGGAALRAAADPRVAVPGVPDPLAPARWEH